MPLLFGGRLPDPERGESVSEQAVRFDRVQIGSYDIWFNRKLGAVGVDLKKTRIVYLAPLPPVREQEEG